MKSLILTTIIVLSLVNGLVAVSDSDVAFYLFTSPSQVNAIQVDKTNASQNINPAGVVLFIIHGWMDSSNSYWVPPLKDAFYTNYSRSGQAANIILVDWSGLAGDLDYFTPAGQVGAVGQIVANLIIALVNNAGVSVANVHVSGHSLGAHVSGFAGKAIASQLGVNLARITGLDPAGPAFYLKTADQRLAPTDASVVQVVHTDRGIAGYINSCGTVDFYPNGGDPPQPGCPVVQAPAYNLTGLTDLLVAFLGCSHLRAPAFYRDALNEPGTLVGTQCGSDLSYALGLCANGQTLDMGGYISPSDSGDFYLLTKATSPYGES